MQRKIKISCIKRTSSFHSKLHFGLEFKNINCFAEIFCETEYFWFTEFTIFIVNFKIQEIPKGKFKYEECLEDRDGMSCCYEEKRC